MQSLFPENWSHIYQSLSKPLTDLTELNISTAANWSKNKSYFEELTQSKKPEDFLNAQMKFANAAQLEALAYARKAGDIWLKAAKEWNEMCSEVMSTTAKTSEMIKHKGKDKE